MDHAAELDQSRRLADLTESEELKADRQSSREGQRPRHVFAYCHDSVGIGHLNRTLAICERIGRSNPSATFLLATGTPYVPLFQPLPRVDYIKLPALAKVDNRTYHGKYLALPPEQLTRCREAVLLSTVQHLEPDFVLIDKAPLGVCRELVPTLQWLRKNRPGTRVVFGMRDIEDEREATIEQWARAGVPEVLEQCFDEIWVYGMRSVYDVVTQYRLSARIQRKLHFMGYVVRDRCTHSAVTSTPTGLASQLAGVLVTVGGGTDGELLLRTYLEGAAVRVAEMGLRSTLVAGPDLPKEAAGPLRALASSIPHVEWVDFEACMDCRIRDAGLVVSMGGYNTLCQIARNRKPALILPRTRPRLEQTIRARLWSQRGAVEVIDPGQLSPTGLGDRVVEALTGAPKTTSPDLDLNGLDRVCERFEACRDWDTEACHATSLRV